MVINWNYSIPNISHVLRSLFQVPVLPFQNTPTLHEMDGHLSEFISLGFCPRSKLRLVLWRPLFAAGGETCSMQPSAKSSSQATLRKGSPPLLIAEENADNPMFSIRKDSATIIAWVRNS